MIREAKFNDDRSHRYMLIREWDLTRDPILWIGLNPSTANEEEDDATIRRVIRFSQDWGYGVAVMMNLFTQVTPYPNELDIFDVGATLQNRADLWHMSQNTHQTVCCWGNFKQAQFEGRVIAERLKYPYCLGQNKNGSPKHPLYIRSDTKPKPFLNYGT